MCRTVSSFRQADLARAIRGARAAGLSVEQLEIEIDPETGKITMRPAPRQGDALSGNDFDRLLAQGRRE